MVGFPQFSSFLPSFLPGYTQEKIEDENLLHAECGHYPTCRCAAPTLDPGHNGHSPRLQKVLYITNTLENGFIKEYVVTSAS